jgi:hypothetical protein
MEMELSHAAHEHTSDYQIEPQSTLTVGEDSLLPSREAKGVGNRRPHTPVVKCGTEFTRKTPPKK